jgi:hypothetical protein
MRHTVHAARWAVAFALAGLSVACATRIEPAFSPEPCVEAVIESLGERIAAQQAELDSLVHARDSLRLDVVRLDLARRSYEDSLRTVQLELKKLKEVDLRPRKAVRPKP